MSTYLYRKRVRIQALALDLLKLLNRLDKQVLRPPRPQTSSRRTPFKITRSISDLKLYLQIYKDQNTSYKTKNVKEKDLEA